MNLGKLLGAGKSFFGGGGSVRYREDRGVYLPKFNAGKNPFSAKSEESSAAPVEKPVAKQASAASAAASATRPVRAANWKDKLNPFRTAEPAVPSMVGAVQPELSLDAVKVVRNDLADADIEVVPVKSQTVSVPEAPMLPPARKSWEFLGERLVKAG